LGLTLLVLEPEPPGLVGPGGPLDPVDSSELTVLPASNAKQVAHHVALLLAVQLRHVLVRSHLEGLEQEQDVPSTYVKKIILFSKHKELVTKLLKEKAIKCIYQVSKRKLKLITALVMSNLIINKCKILYLPSFAKCATGKTENLLEK